MEIKLQEDSILLDDDFTLPFINNWKKTLNDAKEYIKNNVDESKQSLINDKLNTFLNYLVVSGNTTEDVVLKTAILYFLVKEVSFNFNEVKNNYSQPIIECLEILQSNFESIFKNKKYSYLNKVVISRLITDFEFINNLSEANKIKLIAKADKIIKDFSNKTHGKLIKILTDKRTSLK